MTDADVVLGYLDREALLGGDLRIDLAAAERAIDAGVARRLALSVPEAAARIIEVVNSNMAQALRIVSVERGHDPQEFSLIAFGGAGPVHAVALAEELQIPEVIIPPVPLPRMSRQQRLQPRPLRITKVMPLQPVIIHNASQAETSHQDLQDTP